MIKFMDVRREGQEGTLVPLEIVKKLCICSAFE